MARSIAINQQRLRPEYGIGSSHLSERMARDAGALALMPLIRTRVGLQRRIEGIGAAPAHERIAREAGVIAMHELVQPPKPEAQSDSVEEQLNELILADPELAEV